VRPHRVPEALHPGPVGLVEVAGCAGRSMRCDVEDVATRAPPPEGAVGVTPGEVLPVEARKVRTNDSGDFFFGACSPITAIAASERESR
jgi:hypothetical protein